MCAIQTSSPVRTDAIRGCAHLDSDRGIGFVAGSAHPSVSFLRESEGVTQPTLGLPRLDRDDV